jgi:hypothetical protein
MLATPTAPTLQLCRILHSGSDGAALAHRPHRFLHHSSLAAAQKEPELGDHVLKMIPYGLRADAELRRDLTVGVAPREQLPNLSFARGEPRELRRVGQG